MTMKHMRNNRNNRNMYDWTERHFRASYQLSAIIDVTGTAEQCD